MKKFVKIALIAAIAIACLAIGTGEEEEFDVAAEAED